MSYFRIHYVLNDEHQTIDIEKKSAKLAREHFLGRFEDGEPKPMIKKIKVVISEKTDNLPRRQKQIYEFVTAFISEHGHSPTWQEIADPLEFGSKDEAYNCAKPLFRLKILGKKPNAKRSIEVLIQPTGATQ